MIDGKFDVVFRGQIVKSFELETVKANLVKLFKSSPEAVERLFSGVETPIRRGLDYQQAMKYQQALKNAGALALIKEVQQEEPQIKASNEGRASFGPKEEKPAQPTASAEPAQPAAAASPSPQAEPVAPAPAAEPTPAPVAAQPAESAPSGGEMTMAEVGTQILPDKVYEKRDVDTSALSLAQAGERILPEKAPEKHEEPNIDHLSITDYTTPISGERES